MSYTAAEAIKRAKAEIGYRETGTNYTKYNRWLGAIPGYPHSGTGYPWCMSFQAWVADQAGGRTGDYPRTAGCEVAVAWFKARGRWAGKTPHVGDLVFYGENGGTHVELVVALSASSITTVGGNTSGSLSGQYFNGDGVYQKTVARSSSRIYGYGRPAYAAGGEDDDMPSPEDLWNREWKKSDSPVNGWQMDSIVANSNARLRNIEAKLDAQTVTIDKLADALASAQVMTPEQVEDLKLDIRDAIDSIVVHVDTDPKE